MAPLETPWYFTDARQVSVSVGCCIQRTAATAMLERPTPQWLSLSPGASNHTPLEHHTNVKSWPFGNIIEQGTSHAH